MKRRVFLWSGGAVLGAASLAWWQRNEVIGALARLPRNDDVRLSPAPGVDQDLCLLTPEQTEGPFFFQSPVRSDIREDRSGLPLSLRLQVVRADGCQPVAGALVEVWHCDAAGQYSGYPESLSRRPFDTLMFVDGPNDPVEPVNGKTYLRGAQVSDESGLVSFQTILPGWYEPRVPHIHVRVSAGRVRYLASQLYFPDELVRAVYADHPDYAPHGTSPYTHANDGVLGMSPDSEGLLIQPVASESGLTASCKLGVA